jgi:hypothetical protein
MCHMSGVTCHVTGVTSQVSHIFFFCLLFIRFLFVYLFIHSFFCLIIFLFDFQSRNRINLIPCWDGIWFFEVLADGPLICEQITSDLRADHLLICVQINPSSACGSPLRADHPLYLHADQPLICVHFATLSDICADHPLICMQITPWSACRSTPDLRVDCPFIWSLCRSPPDLHAD